MIENHIAEQIGKLTPSAIVIEMWFMLHFQSWLMADQWADNLSKIVKRLRQKISSMEAATSLNEQYLIILTKWNGSVITLLIIVIL